MNGLGEDRWPCPAPLPARLSAEMTEEWPTVVPSNVWRCLRPRRPWLIVGGHLGVRARTGDLLALHIRITPGEYSFNPNTTDESRKSEHVLASGLMRATTMSVAYGYQSAMCGQQVIPHLVGHSTRPAGPVLYGTRAYPVRYRMIVDERAGKLIEDGSRV